MPASPKTLTAIVRRKVREALNLAPGFGKTEAMLLELVNELCGGGVDLQSLRDAMEWNHVEAFIRSEYDSEAEETLWYITKNGIAKQKSLT